MNIRDGFEDIVTYDDAPKNERPLVPHAPLQQQILPTGEKKSPDAVVLIIPVAPHTPAKRQPNEPPEIM